MRPHQLRADRRVPQARHRLRLVPARADGGARGGRLLPRDAQARGAQRAPLAGHDQRAHRRGHRRRRLHADGGDRRQHAVVPPRARAAPGHPLPRGRVAGGHLSADLQAGLARRRREVPARRDAARPERRADRTSRGGVPRHSDGRVLRARRAAHPRDDAAAAGGWPHRRGSRVGDRGGRSCSPARVRRPSSPAMAPSSRKRPRSCGSWRSRSALRWRRR